MGPPSPPDTPRPDDGPLPNDELLSHDTVATDELWEALSDHLTAFSEAWQREPPEIRAVGSRDTTDAIDDQVTVVDGCTDWPPELTEYLPTEPPLLRRMVLVELIKFDMEQRLSRRLEPLGVSDYRRRFPGLLSAKLLPPDLLFEEYHLRAKFGPPLPPEALCKQFPEQAEELRRLLGIGDPTAGTSILPTRPSEELQPGDQIDDFDLLTRLGEGAFAQVFLARQQSLQRLVALKVSANRGSEPQTLAQLDHPHIVRVYDQRIIADRDLRLLYMKYVPGGTLQELVRHLQTVNHPQRNGAVVLAVVDAALDNRGESPPAESPTRKRLESLSWVESICWIGRQLAEALHYAHQHGVLHRDLKPANILLSAEGAPMIVDFNISFNSKLEGATPAAYFGGSLAYMSPEQLEACNPRHARTPDEVGLASDIYSLGVVLWELMIGYRPFPPAPQDGGWSDTLTALAEARRRGVPPEEVKKLESICGRPIVRVLRRCLAPDPESRPASAADLAEALHLCLHPVAQRLVHPPDQHWSHRARPIALWIVAAIAIVSNVLAGLFNYHYNFEHIIRQLNDSFPVFWNVQMAVNAIAFPIGIAICLAVVWPVAQAATAGGGQDLKQTAQLRWRALRLGHFVAMICVVEWAIAGLAYPIALRLGGVALPTADYLHFAISLVLCGLIAATYPFLGISAFSMKVLYPRLLGGDWRDTDPANFRWLERATWFYLTLSFLVPMLGVLLLVSRNTQQTALLLLSGGSLLGCGLACWLARMIHSDLAALRSLASRDG